MKCYACNGENFESRQVELITEVGPHRVLNRTQRRSICVNCGEFTLSSENLEKVELQAALVAFTEAPTVTGEMIRFARKALGLTQTELATRIGTTKESISRWEREERPMEPWVPLTVLALVRERLMPPPTDIEFKRAG